MKWEGNDFQHEGHQIRRKNWKCKHKMQRCACFFTWNHSFVIQMRTGKHLQLKVDEGQVPLTNRWSTQTTTHPRMQQKLHSWGGRAGCLQMSWLVVWFLSSQRGVITDSYIYGLSGWGLFLLLRSELLFWSLFQPLLANRRILDVSPPICKWNFLWRGLVFHNNSLSFCSSLPVFSCLRHSCISSFWPEPWSWCIQGCSLLYPAVWLGHSVILNLSKGAGLCVE